MHPINRVNALKGGGGGGGGEEDIVWTMLIIELLPVHFLNYRMNSL